MKKYMYGAIACAFVLGFGTAEAAPLFQDVERVEEATLSLSQALVEQLGVKLIGAISPKNGESYKAGETVAIKWKPSDIASDAVDIIIAAFESKEGDMPVISDIVALKVENGGSYKYKLPSESSSGYYRFYIAEHSLYGGPLGNLIETGAIKVTGKKNSSIPDVSDMLQEARDKGSNAAAKANLSNARAQAELYYDEHYSYKDVCKKGNASIYNSVTAAGTAVGATADCDSSVTTWAAEVKLKLKEGYYCVDSTGFSVVQKKSKGSSATSCTKKSTKSKSTDMQITKLTGIKKSYATNETIKFSAKVTYGKNKIVPSNEISVYATFIERGSRQVGWAIGTYNTKTKSWDFDLQSPNESGNYEIEVKAYCLDYGTFCTVETYGKSPKEVVSVKITGSSAKSSSAIKILTPNGGERIGNTGSVNMSWEMPVGKAYGTMQYLIPSSDTEFKMINPVAGVRGYSLGGGASPYPNVQAIYSAPQSIGTIPDGKYKLRVYLYTYDAWDKGNYDVSKAIGMDESDGYFTVDTKGSNSY